ncbi:hypothetical protein OG217_11135 [Streptomyces sp. NBC_01023]|uniref:hypothetical protein n=1 Tax=Streptomyces sp. NBC_01023 TaxID=2903724 RepID=UPI003862EA96|nr:hypothetical protein OG217_11135 [Streptomyces sp. NBC_01023]
MTLMSEETEVFGAAPGQRCAVLFLARWRTPGPGDAGRSARAVTEQLAVLRAQGWLLSVDGILAGHGHRAPDTPFVDTPTMYETGFSHDVDFVGMFEAPTASDALNGTLALERAGWARLLRTEWLIGPKEFLPVVGPASRPEEDDWGFFALWKWNSAWQAATAQERRAYDLECDTAFSSDVRDGAAIAGRYRLDSASQWDHVGVWRVPSVAMVQTAMREHTRVADFRFTTSRHYIGRRTALGDAFRRK